MSYKFWIKNFYPFHIVKISPWPFFSGLITITLLRSFLFFFKYKALWTIFLRLLATLLLILIWWRDVNRESVYQGFHSTYVKYGLKLGFLTFVFSEVLLFFSFFWVFFHVRIAPARITGLNWPSYGMYVINPFQIPLLNTLVLLRSGVTVTLAHHQIISNKNFTLSLRSTIILGLYFTCLQLWEYAHAGFRINDSSFGRIFFIATGFHGGHVLVGSVFLLVNFFRCLNFNLRSNRHLRLEIRIYYWHFVDVVWLFLYRFVYWWRF